jgi:DNA-binding transcriptional LysR family regulator
MPTRPVAELDRRLGRRLRLRDIQMLSAVVQWGSMAKAAKHLAMSQPAVSEAIAQLEDALRVRLLDRSPTGVEPTIYADALLKRGNVVLDELQQGIRDIEFLANRGAGEVRVGCPEFIAAGLAPAIIERLSRQYPDVTTHFVDATAGFKEFRALRERAIDLMLARVPDRLPASDLEVEILFEERYFVVAGCNSPWARRRNVVLADLMHERWILQPHLNVMRPIIETAFAAHGLALPREKVSSFSMHLRNLH